MECGISSLKCLSRIPQDHWYRNIARALRTTGLLTLDQHLQIMDFAKTWTITEKHMNSEQIAGFLNSVECLGYH